jgi:hypothetical protein
VSKDWTEQNKYNTFQAELFLAGKRPSQLSTSIPNTMFESILLHSNQVAIQIELYSDVHFISQHRG